MLAALRLTGTATDAAAAAVDSELRKPCGKPDARRTRGYLKVVSCM
jgi:hypothetical protein